MPITGVGGADWHSSRSLVVPAENITLMQLLPYSPELNPVENLDRHAAAPRLNHTLQMGAGQWIMPLALHVLAANHVADGQLYAGLSTHQAQH